MKKMVKMQSRSNQFKMSISVTIENTETNSTASFHFFAMISKMFFKTCDHLNYGCIGVLAKPFGEFGIGWHVSMSLNGDVLEVDGVSPENVDKLRVFEDDDEEEEDECVENCDDEEVDEENCDDEPGDGRQVCCEWFDNDDEQGLVVHRTYSTSLLFSSI